MANRLDGKVAIVTGAGSRGPGVGNGKAAAVLMAREGARVLCVDLHLDRAQETARLIADEGGQATAIQADVTKGDDCRRMVAAAWDDWGRLDILDNNVGIDSRAGIMDVTEAEWDRVLEVDLKSMLLSCQAAIPRMIESGGGSIINLSSVAGLRGTSGTAYPVAKAGAIALTMTLAKQLAEHRIRCNAIAPGYVWTPMVATRMGQEERERRRLAAPLTDEGTAWDVGWAAVFFASDESRWITGQVLAVDGGRTVTTRGT